MKSLIEFFKAGKTYTNREAVDFRIAKFNDITDMIIPFFDKYHIIGIKAQDFSDFKKVAELMKNKVHLTSEGFENICLIKEGMNSGRG